jgi:hypothetical protein
MKATVRIAFAVSVLWAASASATNYVPTRTFPGTSTQTIGPAAGIQLAAEGIVAAAPGADRQRAGHGDPDVDTDEYRAPKASHQAMPGRKAGTNVTAPPNGYDAKHINRLWGRFNGAKTNTKAEKTYKAAARDEGSRPTRWGR